LTREGGGGGRPAVVAFVAYSCLAVIYTFPLVRHLGDALPKDAVDPLFNTWLLWWNAHKLPLTAEWWNAPFFHPTPGVMAFSESLLGLGVIASPAQWLGASPPVAYNLAFLFSFPLSGLAAFLLCHVLTERGDAAFIGGLAYAFAPHRVAEFSHLQVLSSYWVPLSLLGLHLYKRTRRARWLVLFGGAFLAQSLCSLYFLIFLSVLIALWVLWFLRSGRDLAGVAGAWALGVVSLLPLLIRYREVQSFFGFGRSVSHVETYAADIVGLLRGSPLLSHWSSPPPSHAAGLLFPGLTVPALVAVAALGLLRRGPAGPTARPRVGLAFATLAALFALAALSRSIWGPWHVSLGPLSVSVDVLHKPLGLACDFLVLAAATSRRTREARRRGDSFFFYLAAAGVLWVLCLGPSPTFLGMRIWDKAPYWWLMRLPGVSGVRVPSRFAMLAVLCLCVAAAVGLAALVRRLPSGSRLLVLVVAAGVLWDAWLTHLPLVPVPAPSPLAARTGNDGSVLEMPLGGLSDAAALYQSVYHHRPVLNGYSSYYPPYYLPLSIALGMQDDFLPSLPVRDPLYVVVDRTRDPRGSMEAYVARQDGARRIAATPKASVYLVPVHPQPPPVRERRLEIHSIRASDQAALVGLMTDGDVGTSWSTSRRQRGTERIVVDLGSVQTVGSVVLSLGPRRLEFPRELVVETSVGGASWQEAFRGSIVGQLVTACLEDPRAIPLRVDLGERPARYLRLGLGSRDRHRRWSVAELEVWSPVRR
jgi:hypothetical protein